MIALLCSSALGATLTVGVDVATVQEGVDQAADGDVVAVPEGRWEGSVVVSKVVTLSGAGAALTELTADGTVLYVIGGELTLRDLALRDATRGVQVSDGGLTLSGVEITGMRGTSGGGAVYAVRSTVVAVGSTLDDNRVDVNPGGHLWALESEVSLDGCTLTGGRALRGGALALQDSVLVATDTELSGNSVRGDLAPSEGGALWLDAGSATLSDCVFADNTATDGGGGHLSVEDADVFVEGGELRAGLASGYDGGAVLASGGTLTLRSAVVAENAATYGDDETSAHGGALRVVGGLLVLDDVTLVRNVAEGWGGAVSLDGSDLLVQGGEFLENYAYYGAGVYARSAGELVIEGASFTANYGRYGAALRWIPGTLDSSLTVRGCAFTDNEVTGYGAALYARSAGALRIEDSAFTGHRADLGGALMLWSVSEVDVVRSLFCANESRTEDWSDGGAIVSYDSGFGGTHRYVSNVFAENLADARGGALALRESDPALVVNNTFVGNTSRTADLGGAISVRSTPVGITNNLVMSTFGGDGIVGDDAEAVVLSHNALWENLDDDVSPPLATDDTHVVAPPLLQLWTANEDCSDDRLWPQVGSPLIDAGDPDILDLDGTRSDIGALGGPDAAPAQWDDADADGWVAFLDCDDLADGVGPDQTEVPYDGVDQDCDGVDLTDVDGDRHDAVEAGGDDCDDTDPTVYPGRPVDEPYDGVDADCDGADDFDLDGDGHAHDAYGGDDCDDSDATVHPGADDPPGDGVDADCDGVDGEEGPDDPDPPGETCGCETGSPAPALLPLLLLALVRRRSR